MSEPQIEHDDELKRRQTVIYALITSILIVILVGGINYSWFKRCPDSWVYLGTLQSDMQTYTAIFRELFENGNGFFYGSPHEIREHLAVPVFIQFPFILLGWLWRITSLSFPAVWEIFRILFTFFYCISLALLLKLFFKTRGWFILAYIVCLFGSGSIVPFLAIVKGGGVPPTSDGLSSLLASYYYTGQSMHWWGLHLFRNLFYPVELLIHACFFMTIYFLYRRMIVPFVILFFLTWFSGIFGAMELAGIILLWLVLEYTITKDRRIFIFIIIVLFISLIFVVYYKIFIPLYPAGKALEEQHREFPIPPVMLYDYVVHYSLLLVFLIPAFLYREFLKDVSSKPLLRLLIVWIVTVFLFSQNDKFMPGAGIQPPHFLRGYLFMSLAILLIYWFKFACQYNLFDRRIAKTAIAVFCALTFVESLFFTVCMYERLPHPEVSTIRLQTKEMLDYLNTIDETRHVLTLSPNRHLDVILPAQTKHRPYLADCMATPFWSEKFERLQRFISSGFESDLFHEYNIDTLIVRREFFPFMQFWHPSRAKLHMEYENSFWKIYRVELSS